ncbi:MAG: AMP-binding protein [Acidimicrobiales bacterium]
MTTLTAVLDRWAADRPDDVVAEEGDGRRRTLTAGRLAADTPRRAAALAAAGAGPDRAVVAWLPNRIEYLETLAAASAVAAPVVGLNTRYRSDELTHILARSRAAVLVTVDGFAGTDFSAVAAAATLPDDLTVVVVTDPPGPDAADPAGPGPVGRVRAVPAGWRSLGVAVRSWEELGRGDPGPVGGGTPPSEADLLIGFTTSGTTGRPKIAVHDHGGTIIHARADADAYRFGAGDRLLLDLPLCGTFGFSALMAAVAARATTRIHQRFVAEATADALSAGGVTHYFAADDMLLRIFATGRLRAGERLAWREGAFANFVNAGPVVARRAEDELGVRLSGVYGMSEVFALVTRWPSGMDVGLRSRPGGVPVDPTMEVRVVDPETGIDLGTGVDGELCFRGRQVFTRYLGDPDATARAFTPDGWFRSGDLGRLTGDGGFEFLARLGDSLRLRGFLVDPAEIEQRLERHPAVELAQVVGAEVPDRGQVAVAFVRLADPSGDPTVTEADLIAHCAAGIADLKVPARVITVDEFPSVDGPNGRKILKRELRARAADEVAGPLPTRPG